MKTGYEITIGVAVFFLEELISIDVFNFQEVDELKNEKEQFKKISLMILEDFKLSDEEKNKLIDDIYKKKEAEKAASLITYDIKGIDFKIKPTPKKELYSHDKIFMAYANWFLFERVFLPCISDFHDDLENVFYSYTENVLKPKINAPYELIYSYVKNKIENDNEYERQINESSYLSGFSFFENAKKELLETNSTSLLLGKSSIKSFLTKDYDDISFSKFNQKYNSKTLLKKLADERNLLIKRNLLYYSNYEYNDLTKKNYFNSLNIIGFGKIFKKQHYSKHHNIELELNFKLSEYFSNSVIYKILLYFSELGISGEFIEDNEFVIKEGSGVFMRNYSIKPEFKNLKIELSKYANWETKYNEYLEDFFDKLNLDKSLIKYDKKTGAPIIQL